ncbi:Rhodanese domain protein [Pedosphaera parvula Ellin514]|uniref:Rhodanese domain protein n=1 Tax=Pedosphaera parvula (strain Ellin514) TaxID=320771 RepID=B9XH40_PEDPL|nr:DedA family protein/thiosulfate sulfurtransferase GlpE [Pedosphaera parvula]EEF60961.1 Rhodanese domain protein [Pedosphaera parvula Ellin514]
MNGLNETSQFLIRHGLPLLFAAILVEQMGLPIPALPLLLAAGALSATGKFSLSLGIVVTVIACLIADAFWFYLGRYRGNQVLGFLCRISLEPDSCVRRTQNVFTRYGLRGVVVAKFVPGMSTVAPPLAGMAGVGIGRFLLFDGFGSLLYGGLYLCLGHFFSSQMEQIAAAIVHIGGSALGLMAALAAAFISYKYWQRRSLLRELRTARISVAELRQSLDAGENPVILDLRSKAELEQNPSVIRGAIHLVLDEIERRRHEFPHDRDIVVYCSCPNEVSSARVAQLLQRKGFARVRPLLGGIDAWREGDHPMEMRTGNATANVS